MYETKLNVMVVDDDLIYQFTTKKALESIGVTEKVSFCSDGKEAYEYLSNKLSHTDELPDVIFLDINMPVMNGWDFLHAFNKIKHATNKEIRIFIVTSSADKADFSRAQCFSVIEDYIVKPIMPKKFLEILKSPPVH